MRLEFEPQAWEDIRHWLQTDAKKLKRILDLIEAVRRDPFQGIGKPEPLKHHFTHHALPTRLPQNRSPRRHRCRAG
jgi:Txe/YoeB family toxin of toxin-antitoxin system